jgi:hypothetical protein
MLDSDGNKFFWISIFRLIFYWFGICIDNLWFAVNDRRLIPRRHLHESLHQPVSHFDGGEFEQSVVNGVAPRRHNVVHFGTRREEGVVEFSVEFLVAEHNGAAVHEQRLQVIVVALEILAVQILVLGRHGQMHLLRVHSLVREDVALR